MFACNPGAQDLNGDLSDGCEATCTPTGPDVCDGTDNDCDGVVDQASDDLLATCPTLDNTRAVACEAGACVLACEGGFTDLNGDLEQAGSNGCECVGDATVAEVCDGIDNNCDGIADEVNAALVSNCPQLEGASATGCIFGECEYTCDLGRVDINLDLDRADSDGCECTITNNGFEVCDGLDNDCDGRIDEDGPDLLSACAVLGGASVASCGDGVCIWACDQGQVDVDGDLSSLNGNGCECTIINDGIEVCDGLDNDCDGLIDDADDDYVRVFCEPNAGVCADIEAICTEGVLDQCDFDPDLIASTLPNPDLFEGFADTLELVCDGNDGNCDGVVDENCCEAQGNDGVFSVVQPSQNENRQVLPSVAVSPDGQRIVVAWQDTDSNEPNGVPNTGAVVLGFLGQSNGEDVYVDIGRSSQERLLPKMYTHATGPYIAWIESGLTNKSISIQKHTWSGAIDIVDFRIIPTQTEAFNGFDYHVDDNSIIITWASLQGCSNLAASSCIHIKATTSSGANLQDPVELTGEQFASNAINPTIAWSEDTGLVVWHNSSLDFENDSTVSWRIIDNDLTLLSETQSLVLPEGGDAQPQSILYGQGYMIAFIDAVSPVLNQVKLLRIAADGQVIGKPQIAAPSGATQRSPKLIQTPEGIALVWTEGQGASSTVRFVRLDDNGAAVGEPKTLWEGGLFYRPIAVASLPGIGAVVAAAYADAFPPERIQYSTLNADGDRLCLP